jgi:hypothetical protein
LTDEPAFGSPIEFKGPLYNGQSALVDTSPLAILSFTLPSQVPYSPVASQLNSTLRPYFVPTSKSSAPDHDDSDEDMDLGSDEPEEGHLDSGTDTDGDDACSATSIDDEVQEVPESCYTYQSLTFNFASDDSARSYRKRLAGVRNIMTR